ncbi:MAG: hypothetical protein K2U26_04945 [Cyclobacteriaceae bacterium]|nr:hypothetical protein [Cyclobacteriaceae bacterium]
MATKANKQNSELNKLSKLIGTWKLGGDSTGTIRYEWLEGGHFLVQYIDMQLFGKHIKGIEIIGHWKPFGGEADKTIRSRAYDNTGNTLDYVYEVDGNTLTIWGGEKGSPSNFKGKFSKDGRTNTGEWIYPGGGYKSTMTKNK